MLKALRIVNKHAELLIELESKFQGGWLQNALDEATDCNIKIGYTIVLILRACMRSIEVL